MKNLKKKLKLNKDLFEEMTAQEVLKRYEPYINKRAYSASHYAENHYDKHLYAFSYDDIKQIASIGVIKAYNKYDISRDIQFYTYMHKIVVGEISRYLRDIPKFRSQGPNAYDFKYINLDDTFDCSQSGDKKVNISEKIPDENDDIQNFIDETYIHEIISQLDNKSADIIKLYFYENKTQMEIAKILNTSQVQVSRKLSKSFKIMKNYIERSEEKYMNRKVAPIPSLTACISYLKANANKNSSITMTIKKYAQDMGCPLATIQNAVSKSPEYEEIKKLYKETPTWAGSYSKSTNNVKVAKEQNDISVNGNTTLSFMPKEVVQAHLFEDHEEILLTPTPEPIPEFKNTFTGTNVKSVLVELDRSCQAIFDNDRVEFSDMMGSFTREDLIKRKQNIEKAIEIFDYISNS